MLQEIIGVTGQDVANAASSGMSVQTLLLIIGGLMTVITVLGEVIKSQIQKRTNPLNGTLVKLDLSLRELNTTLTKVEMRTADSDRVLEGHTEKLVTLGASVAQLAVNEAAQTQALMSLAPAMQESLTGCANRITAHCDSRSTAIITAMDRRG